VKIPVRYIECCLTASSSITWRYASSFIGPRAEGWSMISHVCLGTPEYINVRHCPFCGSTLVQKPLQATGSLV